MGRAAACRSPRRAVALWPMDQCDVKTKKGRVLNAKLESCAIVPIVLPELVGSVGPFLKNRQRARGLPRAGRLRARAAPELGRPALHARLALGHARPLGRNRGVGLFSFLKRFSIVLQFQGYSKLINSL